MKKILIYLILPILLSACADEQYELTGPEDLLDVPEGKVQINMDITAGNFHKPGTKSGNPDAEFSNPYIMSFRITNTGSTTDTILYEVVETTISGGKYNAVLTKSTEPHLLVFIANADALVRHRITNHSIITKRYGEVMPLFTYGDPTNEGSFGLSGLKNPTTFVPFVNERIPMWAKLNIDKVEPGSKISTPVFLQRIVSKLYIDARQANNKDNFTLTGFTVLGVPSLAYFDNDGAADPNSPQTTVNYGRSSSGNNSIDELIINSIPGNTTQSVTNDKPVYVFPFRKGDERGGVYHILFSGHFGDNVIRYFKVKIAGKDNPAALNKPNTSYLINIESIANNGHVSLAQALQNEPGTGIVVIVTVIDDSHEIIADGKYFLGLTNSEFQLYADGEQKGVTVATVGTNAFNSGVQAPKTNIELIEGKGVTLSGIPVISSNSTAIKVDFDANKEASGIIRVTIGNLVRDITVKKDWAITGNFKAGDEGFLIASDVISAHAIDNNLRIGLGTTKTSVERNQTIQSATATGAYLFIKNTIDEDILEVRALTVTGRTILVRNVTNIPEFAGNNIYWDELNDRPKFDDYITAANEGTLNVQGMTGFSLGSLILAPGGSDPNRPSLIKSPTGRKYNKAITLSLYYTVPFDAYSENKITMRPNEDIGDICEFMTRRRITPSSKTGKKWKLPEMTDISRLPLRFINSSYEFPGYHTDEFQLESGLSKTNNYASIADLFLLPSTVIATRYPNNGTLMPDIYINRLHPMILINKLNIHNNDPSWPAASWYVLSSRFGSFNIASCQNSSSSPKNGFPLRCVRDDSPGAVVPLYKIEYDLSVEPGETIGNITNEVSLAKFQDPGELFILSSVKLTSAKGREHVGWIVNGLEYPLVGSSLTVNSDVKIKPKWN